MEIRARPREVHSKTLYIEKKKKIRPLKILRASNIKIFAQTFNSATFGLILNQVTVETKRKFRNAAIARRSLDLLVFLPLNRLFVPLSGT